MLKIAPTFTVRSVLLNFGPWLVYGCVSAAGHAGWAYVGGLIASLCQTAPQWRARRVKIMDGVSLMFFLAGAVSTVGFHFTLFPRSGSILVWSTFAVVAWGSLLARSPFTAEYARGSVPETLWNNPAFRRVNVTITAVWGAVFAINAALAAMMALRFGGQSGHTETLLQAAPYMGTLFGIVFTNRFPQWASRQGSKEHQTEIPTAAHAAGIGNKKGTMTMTDKADEVAATGGSRPAATGPGATGGSPTNGGTAVPDAEVLMGGSGSLGDTGSLDDAGQNNGDSLEESGGATESPQSAMPNTENATGTGKVSESGDAPTGGLSGTPVPSSGTVGGSPTGTTASGVGDKGG